MAWVTSNFCEQYFLDTTTTSYIDDDDFVQDKSFARHLSAVNWRSKLGLKASASTRRGLDKRYQFLKEKNSVKSREEFFRAPSPVAYPQYHIWNHCADDNWEKTEKF